MQAVAIISGLVELVLSFALAILVTWASFRVFGWMTRHLDEMAELKRNNAAAGILFASMLLAAALVVREALFPTISSLRTALFQGFSAPALAKVVGLGLLYIGATVAGAVWGVAVAARLFLRMTRSIDELEEIRNNNLAVAMALGAVIVTMGLFMAHGLQSLLSALVPYPAVETIRIMGQ